MTFEHLTNRARSFIGAHGVRADAGPVVEELRQPWLDHGVPAAVVDRMAAYQRRWGGLVLPPSPVYDGGPKQLCADLPDNSHAEGWSFEAGPQRTALPYGFWIGPSGEFAIDGDHWAPLHASIEGWVEALALAHHAASWARQITKVTGEDVDAIDLTGFEPVPEVRGLADTWWRGPDSLIAVHTGEAVALSWPRGRTAWIYSGLDNWGLHGGVPDDD
ncbi:hypothetical protein [Kitasatospora sp. NPDC101183]|uniref:hypothetical protein n=1 Tax=Kitasatospora sp. NPDC101183 TaxID=3364100 RepID=UPI003811A0E5